MLIIVLSVMVFDIASGSAGYECVFQSGAGNGQTEKISHTLTDQECAAACFEQGYDGATVCVFNCGCYCETGMTEVFPRVLFKSCFLVQYSPDPEPVETSIPSKQIQQNDIDHTINCSSLYMVCVALFLCYYAMVFIASVLSRRHIFCKGMGETLFGDRICSGETLCHDWRTIRNRPNGSYWKYLSESKKLAIWTMLAQVVDVVSDFLFAKEAYCDPNKRCVGYISGASVGCSIMFLVLSWYNDYSNWKHGQRSNERTMYKLRWSVLVMIPVEDLIQFVCSVFVFATSGGTYIVYFSVITSFCMIMIRLFSVYFHARGFNEGSDSTPGIEESREVPTDGTAKRDIEGGTTIPYSRSQRKPGTSSRMSRIPHDSWWSADSHLKPGTASRMSRIPNDFVGVDEGSSIPDTPYTELTPGENRIELTVESSDYSPETPMAASPPTKPSNVDSSFVNAFAPFEETDEETSTAEQIVDDINEGNKLSLEDVAAVTPSIPSLCI